MTIEQTEISLLIFRNRFPYMWYIPVVKNQRFTGNRHFPIFKPNDSFTYYQGDFMKISPVKFRNSCALNLTSFKDIEVAHFGQM